MVRRTAGLLYLDKVGYSRSSGCGKAVNAQRFPRQLRCRAFSIAPLTIQTAAPLRYAGFPVEIRGANVLGTVG